MNLVDEEQHLTGTLYYLVYDHLESLLELALILCTRNQCAHIERIDPLREQIFGYIAIDDAVGNTLHNGGLSDSRLTHKDGVVFGATREDLQHSANLLVATNHRVQLTLSCHLVEVYGVTR